MASFLKKPTIPLCGLPPAMPGRDRRPLQGLIRQAEPLPQEIGVRHSPQAVEGPRAEAGQPGSRDVLLVGLRAEDQEVLVIAADCAPGG